MGSGTEITLSVTISKGSEGTVNQVGGVKPVLDQIFTIFRTDGFSCSGYCQSIWTDYWRRRRGAIFVLSEGVR